MGAVTYLKILLGVCVVLLTVKFVVQSSKSASVVGEGDTVHNPSPVERSDAAEHTLALMNDVGTPGQDQSSHSTVLEYLEEADSNLKVNLQKGKKLKNCTFFYSFPPLPQVKDHTCRDRACSEYLDEIDQANYRYCAVKTIRNSHKPISCESVLSLSGKCRFMNGSRRAPVGLVSFPGSGNTWVRGLLEQATGICTGAEYCDASIRGGGFTGESLRSGAVIVVKTHYHRQVFWTDVDRPVRNYEKHSSYGAAVFIIRNPFDAFVADWQRFVSKKLSQGSHHVDVLNHTYFGAHPGWTKYVKTKTIIWKTFFFSWVTTARKGHHPLHVVRYEDLKQDTFGEVWKILEFLGMEYSPDQVKKNLEQGFNTFKRKKRAEFEHFTPEQRALIRDCISKSLDHLRTKNNGMTYGIESYLNG